MIIVRQSFVPDWGYWDRCVCILCFVGPFGVGVGGFDPQPRHTKDVQTGRFALRAWYLALMSLAARSQYNDLSDSFLPTCGGFESVALCPKTGRRRSFGPNKTGPN